ncbi:MAG: hypothetical protein K9J37_23525 [Saprospiraceae bacterium]|nr:hypothetical protein [Saprospiraceae bacterium]MCF8252897.1 hypothetical protein [Saprospiraceae bacterium]MCF8314443.1 hypothetical protein [Saprospiraceae bacterium]
MQCVNPHPVCNPLPPSFPSVSGQKQFKPRQPPPPHQAPSTKLIILYENQQVSIGYSRVVFRVVLFVLCLNVVGFGVCNLGRLKKESHRVKNDGRFDLRNGLGRQKSGGFDLRNGFSNVIGH